MKRIPEGSAPDFKNKSWTIAAEVNIPNGGAEGVLATIGGRFGGWALLLLQGKPVFAYTCSNQPKYKWKVQAAQPLPPGDHIVRVAFKYDGGGIGRGATATLLVDEKPAGELKIPQTIPIRFSLDETFDVGEDTGTPVIEDYAEKMPFRFTGTLNKFVVVLDPSSLSPEEQKRLHDALAKVMMSVQ